MMNPVPPGFVQFDCFLDFMTRESTDVDTAEQIIDSFRILAADKVKEIIEEGDYDVIDIGGGVMTS